MSDVVSKGGYAWTDAHANGFDEEKLFNLPRAGASAGAGVGYVRVKKRDIRSEAKGPNAEAGAEASLASLRARACAKAEVGSAQMKLKRDGAVFAAEVKGPNAEAGAEASLTSSSISASVKAGLGSVSATAGNLKSTLGLAADAKVKADLEGVEAKVCGTGIKLGRKVGVSVLGSSLEFDLLGDTIKRPGSASAKGLYARTKRDKSGVSASAGLGQAGAQWSVFDVGAKGPNAEAEAGVGAMARAEVGSASAAVGNVKATVGLAVDTGAKVADGTVEAKLLGTGFKLGRTTGVSLFGSSFELKIW